MSHAAQSNQGTLDKQNIRAGLEQEQGLVRPQRGKEGHPGKEEWPGPRLCASIERLARCVWDSGVVLPCGRDTWLVKGLLGFGKS